MADPSEQNLEAWPLLKDLPIVETATDSSMAKPSEMNPEPSKQSSEAPRIPFFAESSSKSITELSDDKEQSNIDNTSSFVLELRPACKLKHAIAALGDEEFNEQGTAMIEVEHKKVTVTVRNTENKVLGYLQLNAMSFLKFDFQKPLNRKIINLNHISQHLDLADDDDTVTIYHLQESNELSFKFGSTDVIKVGVELQEIDAAFEKFPNITYACECIILNKDLWTLLGRLEESESKLASVGISDSVVTLFVGRAGTRIQYNDQKTSAIRGIEPEQVHHVWFRWPYCNSLKKASLLTKGVLLSLVTDPPDSIMWRFNLQKYGDLAYIKKATVFMPNFQPEAYEGGLDGIVEHIYKLEASKDLSITKPLKDLSDNEDQSKIDKVLSNEGSSKNSNSFSLELQPVCKLKHAIAALSDEEFNEQGTAMIEVEHKEVTITVRNTEKKVLAYLQLYATGFVKFNLQKPLNRKMINLNNISQHLDLADDNDTVTIYHVEESNELSFMFGSTHVVKFGVELQEVDAAFGKFPNVTYACECIILNKDLWTLLGRIEESESKLVSVGVADKVVTLFVGRKGTRIQYNDPKNQISAIRGMEPEQVHHVWFRWPYCNSLKVASLLTKGVLLCVVIDPKDSIMWRFNLQQLGDLVYIKEAIVFLPNFKPEAYEGGLDGIVKHISELEASSN